MAFDRFLIAPLSTGLQTDLRPWLIPDDAFSILQNAYVFRGRVRKRFGSLLMGSSSTSSNLDQLLSRLRINIGTTDAVTGNFSLTPVTPAGSIWKIGQMFSVGTTIFTVYQANGATLTTGTATATFNTATGALVITGNNTNPLTTVYFYPAEPVMGFSIFDSTSVNNQPTYAFDTRFAYIYLATGWERSGTGTSPMWHGTNLNFFWSVNYRNSANPGAYLLFVSNFYAVNPSGAVSANDDPIWYLNSISGTWTALTPKFLVAGAGNFVRTARIVVVFKNRLVLLNTIETDAANANNISYPFRARFSAIDNPLDANAFLEITQVGTLGGGVIDVPTQENIITAQFVKDRLIVYCERSTWELAYTGNQIIPFEWNQINTELGSESTFSVVPFDLNILAIGATGVHSCNGTNVNRIDNKIPDEIFEIKNKNNAALRVFGIRDYFNEVVYWAYPQDDEIAVDTYPNKILLYNYRNDTWAINDDCITAFGYYEQQADRLWSTTHNTWEESNETWVSGIIAAQAKQTIAGNQEGFTFIISSDTARNCPSMQVTAFSAFVNFVATVKIIDHTLAESNSPTDGDYIVFEGMNGMVNLNGLIKPVLQVIDKDTITVQFTAADNISGTYTGGGTVARVSNINVRSKQWNPYDKEGQNVYLARIDFAVTRTENGEILVDYYPSASELSMVQAGSATNAIMGNNVLETKPYDITLYPFEQYQDRLWHPVYFQSSGECIQIDIYMTDTQMRTNAITWSDFEIQGLVLHTARASDRLQ